MRPKAWPAKVNSGGQENTEKARSRSAAQRRRDIPAGDRSEGDLILYRRR
jgi:hypothetical protein